MTPNDSAVGDPPTSSDQSNPTLIPSADFLQASDNMRPVTATARPWWLAVLATFALYTALFLACLLGPSLGMYLMFSAGQPMPTQYWILEAGYSALFGAMVALPAYLFRRLAKPRSPFRGLFRWGLGAICIITPVPLMIARGHLPNSNWHELPRPPLPLARLVTTSTISVLGGDVYGATRDGKLYAFTCWFSHQCEWQAVDEVAPKEYPEATWGKCFGSQGRPILWLLPPPPAAVLDRYSTLYCGPDYAVETHFLLTTDSRVYSLQASDGMGEGILACLRVPAAVVVAGLGLLLTGRVPVRPGTRGRRP
jgi:hypothetical protein